MDDGGKAQNTRRAAYINATSFTSSERILLQKAVQNVFGLKINIQKAGGNSQYNFYIPASSYEKFCEIVFYHFLWGRGPKEAKMIVQFY
jgi:hypothetical protein